MADRAQMLRGAMEEFKQRPDFQALDPATQKTKMVEFAQKYDKLLGPQLQQGTSPQVGFQSGERIPSRGTQPEPGSRGGAAVLAQHAQGFNDVFESILFLPSDAIDDALKLSGIVDQDAEPIGSTVKRGFDFFRAPEPQGTAERVGRGSGEFLGETLIGLGGTMKLAQGVSKAVRGEQLLPARINETGIKEQTKRLGRAFSFAVEGLSKLDPKLLLAGDVLAGEGAGVTGELLAEMYPEQADVARAYGQFVGAFGPEGGKALFRAIWLRTAKPLRTGVFGLTEEEIRSDISRRLQEAFEPNLREIDFQLKQPGADKVLLQQQREGLLDSIQERTDAMLTRVNELKEEFGVELTTGQMADISGLTLTERNVEGFTPPALTKFKRQLDQNVDRVVNSVMAEQPAADSKLVDRFVRNFYNDSIEEWDFRLSRAQAEIDATTAQVEFRNQQMLQDAERIFERAEARALDAIDRLKIRQGATPAEFGQAIREARDIEIGQFRGRFSQEYEQMSQRMQRVRVPVDDIQKAVDDLQLELTPDVTNPKRIPDRIMDQISNLGTDYRLELQAQHALEDLGAKRAGGRGFRSFDFDVSGQGGTPEITGSSNRLPDYLRDLNMNEAQLEKALNALASTQVKPKNMETTTWERVIEAIKRNPEFERGPNFDGDMLFALGERPSVTFETLKNLRSDLLTEIRFSQAGRNDQLTRRLELLLDASEHSMQIVADNPRYVAVAGDLVPEFRDLSARYRAEVVRLKQGSIADIGRRDITGRLRVRDEEVAGKFIANETSMKEFVAALGDHPQAQQAVEHMLRYDFIKKFYDPGTKKFKMDAARAWISNRDHVWHHFPELRDTFTDTVKLQQEMNAVRGRVQQMEKMRKDDPNGLANMFGGLEAQDRAQAVRKLDEYGQALKQWKADFHKNMASEFLGSDVAHVAQKAMNSKNPRGKIQELLGFLGTLPDGQLAQDGMKRALFDAVAAKFQGKAASTRTPNGLAGVLREITTRHGEWMADVFGAEKVKKLKDATEVLATLGITERPIQRGTSETAMNLVNVVNEISPWLSRWFAVQSGRVPWLYGVADRVIRRLNRNALQYTEETVHRLMEEAFFDPQVGASMLQWYRGGEGAALNRRIRGHFLAMGGSAFEGIVAEDTPPPEPQRETRVISEQDLIRQSPTAGIAVVR